MTEKQKHLNSQLLLSQPNSDQTCIHNKKSSLMAAFLFERAFLTEVRKTLRYSGLLLCSTSCDRARVHYRQHNCLFLV